MGPYESIESPVLEFNCESGDGDVRGISFLCQAHIYGKKSEPGLLRERHNRRKPMLQYRYIDYSVVVIPMQTCVCKQI